MFNAINLDTAWRKLTAVTALAACLFGCAAARADVICTNPAVQNGLSISAAGRNLVLSPGICWINDQKITTDKPQKIVVPSVPNLSVSNEPVQLSEKEPQYLKNAHACEIDLTVLPNVVVPASIKVKSSSRGGMCYELKKDYALDGLARICLVPGSRIIKAVLVDYQCLQQRLDTLVMDSHGTARLIHGTPGRSAPLPGVVPDNCLPLAHILVAPGTQAIVDGDIMPIRTANCLHLGVDPVSSKKILSRIKEKLIAGQPITIVFWGDSLTGGSDATSPEFSFPQRFLKHLHEFAPAAQINSIVAAVGGSTTDSRLPTIRQDVLAHKPDLVVIEFINDVKMSQDALEENYNAVAAKLNTLDAEVILVNPHFPNPEFFNMHNFATVASRPYYSFARNFAKEQHWVLADVAKCWEKLSNLGLTPEVLLVDKRVHMNNLGHQIYADVLGQCFAF